MIRDDSVSSEVGIEENPVEMRQEIGKRETRDVRVLKMVGKFIRNGKRARKRE